MPSAHPPRLRKPTKVVEIKPPDIQVEEKERFSTNEAQSDHKSMYIDEDLVPPTR